MFVRDTLSDLMKPFGMAARELDGLQDKIRRLEAVSAASS